jgi:hypothetical protein
MIIEQPIHRLIFRAQLRPGVDEDSTLVETLVGMSDREHLTRLCLFARERDLFIYTECADPIWTPEQTLASVAELLEPWPGAEKTRRWIPMMDIFHYQRCVAVERRQRREPPVNRWGRVVRLRPEKVSSYIYYHYQMQEEESGDDSMEPHFAPWADSKPPIWRDCRLIAAV